MTPPFDQRGLPRRLLLSIHDVTPRHARQVAILREHLRRDGEAPLAMLVVPAFGGDTPIIAGSPFGRQLRRWAEEGDEIFLHGFTHKDNVRHDTSVARFKASRLTAGEGEFLGLSRDEASRLIAHGRDVVEEATGKPIAGFIAPAWLYGPGARAALQEAGILLAEDHWRVWSPPSDRILSRSPVITWATRTAARQASSLLVASLARLLPRPRVMRVGVHPGDCGAPPVMDSIAATVRALRRTHQPGRYAALLEDASCAS